jgi:hypothetical protein
MSKVIIGTEEVINLRMMLNSQEEDNRNMAFMAIENSDIKRSSDAIYVLYKFVNVTPEEWKQNCPKMIKYLESIKMLESSDLKNIGTPSMPVVFHKLINHKADKEVMLLFLDFHSKHLMSIMDAWGYPTDKFEIITKLKDNAE